MLRTIPDHASTKHYLVAIAFVLAAAALRFYHLEDQSLWNDEMFSLDVSTRSLGDVQPRLVAYYHHPPLFFYLAHAALKLFGYSAWALRSTPALFGALTVGLVCIVAHRLFSDRAGVAAGLLCLVAPFQLAYSQEGRPYALAAFLCLLSSYLLYLYIDERKTKWLFTYIGGTTALLYTHHWGVFVLAAQFISVLFHYSSMPSFQKKHLWIAWFTITLLYFPEFFALRHQDVTTPASTWFWVQEPSPGEAYHLLTAFSGTYFNLASSIFSLSVGLQVIGAVSIALIICASIVRTAMNRMNSCFRFVLICFGGTLLIPFFISFFKPEVFLWYRYTVIAFPLLCVMVGGVVSGGVVRNGMLECWNVERVCVWIVVAILFSIGVMGDIHYFSDWHKANAKDVAEYVNAVTREYDVKMIIRPKKFAPLLNYYYHGDAVQYDEAYLETPLGAIIDTARSFVFVSLDVPNDIRSYMDGHFDKIAERHFPGEAHMGMLVGVYRQKPEEDESTTK